MTCNCGPITSQPSDNETVHHQYFQNPCLVCGKTHFRQQTTVSGTLCGCRCGTSSSTSQDSRPIDGPYGRKRNGLDPVAGESGYKYDSPQPQVNARQDRQFQETGVVTVSPSTTNQYTTTSGANKGPAEIQYGRTVKSSDTGIMTRQPIKCPSVLAAEMKDGKKRMGNTPTKPSYPAVVQVPEQMGKGQQYHAQQPPAQRFQMPQSQSMTKSQQTMPPSQLPMIQSSLLKVQYSMNQAPPPSFKGQPSSTIQATISSQPNESNRATIRDVYKDGRNDISQPSETIMVSAAYPMNQTPLSSIKSQPSSPAQAQVISSLYSQPIDSHRTITSTAAQSPEVYKDLDDTDQNNDTTAAYFESILPGFIPEKEQPIISETAPAPQFYKNAYGDYGTYSDYSGEQMDYAGSQILLPPMDGPCHREPFCLRCYSARSRELMKNEGCTFTTCPETNEGYAYDDVGEQCNKDKAVNTEKSKKRLCFFKKKRK